MKYAIYDIKSGRIDRLVSVADEIGTAIAAHQCAENEAFVEVEEHVKTSSHVVADGHAVEKAHE